MTKKSTALVMCCVGLSAFFIVTRSPQFGLLRAQDIVLLIISGGCFAIALAALAGLLAYRKER